MGESCSSWQTVLAEDNPVDVGMVRAALREHGVDCELHVIGDGEEALSFIDSLDLNSKIPCPDLLRLDLCLPKRDGNISGRVNGAPEHRSWSSPLPTRHRTTRTRIEM
jgi:hypothetical protein